MNFQTIVPIVETTLGLAVVCAGLAFAVLYDRVEWFQSYVGRTTMLSTVGVGALIGFTMICFGMDLLNLVHPTIMMAGVLSLYVIIRKIKALNRAQRKLRLECAEERARVVQHELNPNITEGDPE